MNAPQRECPVDVVNALIEVEQRDQPCWRVSKVLGSMLVLDFGGRVSRQMLRGGQVDVGASILSIRNVYWTFAAPDTPEVDSDTVTCEQVLDMQAALSGATLQGIRHEQQDLIVHFSKLSAFTIDLTNVYEVEPEKEIAELQLSGGLHVDLTPEGRFLLNVEESVRERAAA